MKAVLVLLVVLAKNIICDHTSLNESRLDITNGLFVKRWVSGVPSNIIMVYEGAVARLPCLLGAMNDKSPPFWMFAKTTLDPFTPILIQDRDRMVMANSNITIYHVTASDAGIYRCRSNNTICGIVILEVVDYDNYTVGRHCSSEVLRQELVVYSLWSPWSECSVCGAFGKRRRFGICYVKNKNGYHKNGTNNIFGLFLDGIPCRSQYLPREIQRLQSVANRTDQIMIAICKVPCQRTIFEVRSNGTSDERADNSAGLYSLRQPLPAQLPPPARDIVFVTRGQRIVVRCPGTTLRDVVIRWRVGTRWLRAGGQRVYVNTRDHVIIRTVANEDANIYSCWERDSLAGTVKLFVWEGEVMRWNHRSTQLLLVVACAFIIRVLFTILQSPNYTVNL